MLYTVLTVLGVFLETTGIQFSILAIHSLSQRQIEILFPLTCANYLVRNNRTLIELLMCTQTDIA